MAFISANNLTLSVIEEFRDQYGPELEGFLEDINRNQILKEI